MKVDARKPQRSKAELLSMYNEYAANKSLHTHTEWMSILKISPSTFSKWQKDIPPKLPKQSSIDLYEKYKSEPTTTREAISGETFEEIAEELCMSEKDVIDAYRSGMEKIQLMIKNNSTYGSTLRSFLDYQEARIFDTCY